MHKRALHLANQFKLAVDQILPPSTERSERIGKMHPTPLHQFEDDTFGMSSKTKRERSKAELDDLQRVLVSQTDEKNSSEPIKDVQKFLSNVNSDNIIPICKKVINSEVTFAQPLEAFRGLLEQVMEMFSRGNREVVPVLAALRKRIKQIEADMR